MAASSSSSLTMPSNDALTMPSPSTTKIHGSDSSFHSRVAAAEGQRIVGQDRLELAVDVLELRRARR